MDSLAKYAPAPVTRIASGLYLTDSNWSLVHVDVNLWNVTQPDGKVINCQDTLLRARRNVTALTSCPHCGTVHDADCPEGHAAWQAAANAAERRGGHAERMIP